MVDDSSVVDLKIEKPKLDLKKLSHHKKLPKEIPDLLSGVGDDDIPPAILKVDALIREIEIYLSINDVHTAKTAYQELNNAYNALSEDDKRLYYHKVREIFNKIKEKDSFFYKIKSFFKK